ncbi:MAG TPA: hypothetical protein DEG17_16180 [Cyanobacteria bacterium UBA11149]|nr:hypothetical protein [Cyanobacteria bacterium UBA11367]HBE59501.1 hypothetical protein [Cyanobacteria bacterium UBA11366]HBK66879.1 hypothetical protein [Cyanobacteria bacterium UBA11166]HBR76848.1 hypothetical protein [Cyanobacteria bacterium UBA11159]HBS67698.1 hypothetical protein [Cyanobacteria bacterium UBA11153]HBW90364.1 hypothetical protein [Cyanobacteria bacterium UBA11149]HCA93243.1 hypothetical protein [Cyanobacteria bacterium UBA9226]
MLHLLLARRVFSSDLKQSRFELGDRSSEKRICDRTAEGRRSHPVQLSHWYGGNGLDCEWKKRLGKMGQANL